MPTNNNITRSSSSNSSSTIVQLGQFKFNKDRAAKTVTKTYDFLNPSEDFIGIIECKGNIRKLEKKGEMKQDLQVVDCHIVVGAETREVEEHTEYGTLIRRKEEKYKDQDVSLVLTKTVLYNKFKKLQDSLQNLTGQHIVVIGLGRSGDKQYFDFYVATEEQAKQDGVLQVVNNL